MYFYVDESGHTGANLFDSAQPMLYYGSLSSRLNLDLVAEDRVAAMRKQLGVVRLHASELGNGRLALIAKDIAKIQKQCDLRFDVYRVAKPDHAIISFFDQVFDSGMNPAMTWTGYWTPLRYMLLLKVASLFDEELAKNAWDARIEVDKETAEAGLVYVCKELAKRIHKLPDERSRQLVGDSLAWAAAHPSEIYYNVTDNAGILQITPNVIGFQSVLIGIANRLSRTKVAVSKITVDRQDQFNPAQKTLSEHYQILKKASLRNGPGLPELNFKDIPDVPIQFSSGLESCGLELTDVYLWIFKRLMEDKELARECAILVRPQLRRGRTDEISINALASRWGDWFEALPEPTGEQAEKAKEIMALDEGRRLKGMNQ